MTADAASKTLPVRLLACLLALPLVTLAPAAAAQTRTTATLAMTLETPGLDPTAGAASAISEVVLYNVFETLTKIRPDGSVGPLLAQSWTVTPDSKTWSFKLVPGVKFHNGEAFNAETVRFSLERVTFRFISEAAAPVAALLAGDVDAFPRVSAARSLKQFEANKKFQVLVGGVALPLQLTIKLPPTPYARAGGEIVAAQLAKVGITATLENIEWAQWLSGVYGQKAYDLTLMAQVEPLDFGNFGRPNDYWNCESPAFNALWARINATADAKQRAELLGQAQRLVADEAVAAYLYQPTWITVADARLQGPWKDMPILANDLSALRWK